MIKQTRTGNRIVAEKLQRTNGVVGKLVGPWYHGTDNGANKSLSNSGSDRTYLTRSTDGGKVGSTHVLTVFIVDPLTDYELTPARAGDDGGTDPNDPRLKRPDWWINLSSEEVDRLMVVSSRELPPQESQVEIQSDLNADNQTMTLDGLLKSDWAHRKDQANTDETQP